MFNGVVKSNMLKALGSLLIFKRAINTCQNIIKSPVADINISRNILLSEYLQENLYKADKIALVRFHVMA